MTEPQIRKRDIDAMQPVTRSEFEEHEHEPEMWGFPGAGILSLVLMVATILISVVSIHISLVNDAKRDATDKCIAYYLGR